MTLMTAAIPVPHGAGRRTSLTTRLGVASEDSPRIRRRRLGLASGNLLRIRDGRGVRVTAGSGVLWITEEGSPADVVLMPGQAHRIATAGLALVLALRRARVVLEASAGSPSMERAAADGLPGRGVAFGVAGAYRFEALAQAFAAVLRRLIVGFRAAGGRGSAMPPTGGWAEHDRSYSSRRVRAGDQAWFRDEPVASARDVTSHRVFFPYY